MLRCEGLPLWASRFFLIGGMVSFALVAWFILLWYVAAMRLLLVLWLLWDLLLNACALAASGLAAKCLCFGLVCGHGAFFGCAALRGGKAWVGIGEIFH